MKLNSFSFDINFIKRRLVNNRDGFAIVTALIFALLVLATIFGMRYFMQLQVGMRQRTKFERALEGAFHNITSLISSQKAWQATVTRLGGCTPGQGACLMRFFYNESDPEATDAYNTPSAEVGNKKKNKGLKVWATNQQNASVAYAFLDIAGYPLFFDEAAANACSTSSDVNCIPNNEKKDPSKYMRIEIRPPATFPAGEIPDYSIRVADVVQTKRIETKSLSENRVDDSVFNPQRMDCETQGDLMYGFEIDGTPLCRPPKFSNAPGCPPAEYNHRGYFFDLNRNRLERQPYLSRTYYVNKVSKLGVETCAWQNVAPPPPRRIGGCDCVPYNANSRFCYTASRPGAFNTCGLERFQGVECQSTYVCWGVGRANNRLLGCDRDGRAPRGQWAINGRVFINGRGNRLKSFQCYDR